MDTTDPTGYFFDGRISSTKEMVSGEFWGYEIAKCLVGWLWIAFFDTQPTKKASFVNRGIIILSIDIPNVGRSMPTEFRGPKCVDSSF